MSQWPSLKESDWLQKVLGDKEAVRHWDNILENTYQGLNDTWDIQWMFTCWVHHGLTILPNKNLVANIGFGADATHTKTDTYGVANLQAMEMEFPLKHPLTIMRDEGADRFTFSRIFAREVDRPNLYRRIGRRLLSSLPETMQVSIADLRSKLR